ncbi:MAG: Gfo/Idh/MocA family oxidoreductase, partial [Armatimonadetes bacterium]|nr:Gfo/Idh/MocA family oxidoreductase [Armatimonadota bacterium]
MTTTTDPAKRSRRDFIKTAAATAVAAPTVVPASALGRDGAVAPSERIALGAIGVNGMGQANLNACASRADVEVVGICDVAASRRDPLVERFKATAKGYNDYRELLARSDVDAVIIATPPHWHALIAIDACKAGKDIYVQKPMTMG